MEGPRYTKLLFYGSTDLEEYLEWEEQMEYAFELQEFSEAKKVLCAALELFEDYASNWWKQYPHKHFIET
uniref:Uncharacterized protein n=1 Tax=Arundo donax TaxID=35708 RepID=A0A0A8YX78_ARUDO